MRISGLASRMFKVAHEMKLIDDTPFKTTLLRVRSHRGGHHKALPDAEVSRIKREIPTLQDERQRLYMALLVYTGMRREEVLGLGWENIHLDENYGEVKRVVVFPNNAKAVVKENPKTEASERTFIILRPQPPRRGDKVAGSGGEFERISVKKMHRPLHRTKRVKALRDKRLKRKQKERKCTFGCTSAPNLYRKDFRTQKKNA